MASRIVYGLPLASRAWRWLAAVAPKRHTPVRATAAISVLVLVLGLWLPLTTLAQITSTIILVVFLLVNLSLVRIRIGEETPPEGVPRYPLWVPLAGSLATVALLPDPHRDVDPLGDQLDGYGVRARERREGGREQDGGVVHLQPREGR